MPAKSVQDVKSIRQIADSVSFVDLRRLAISLGTLILEIRGIRDTLRGHAHEKRHGRYGWGGGTYVSSES